jgi:hypothetical protein
VTVLKKAKKVSSNGGSGTQELKTQKLIKINNSLIGKLCLAIGLPLIKLVSNMKP